MVVFPVPKPPAIITFTERVPAAASARPVGMVKAFEVH